MVSLLLLSHSKDIAEGLKELALEMSPNISVHAIGGTNTGTTGSDYERMKSVLLQALENGAVVILFDLGSTLMTIQMVIEELDLAQQKEVYLSDAALVEGAIVAAVHIDAGAPAQEVVARLKPLSLGKIT